MNKHQEILLGVARESIIREADTLLDRILEEENNKQNARQAAWFFYAQKTNSHCFPFFLALVIFFAKILAREIVLFLLIYRHGTLCWICYHWQFSDKHFNFALHKSNNETSCKILQSVFVGTAWNGVCRMLSTFRTFEPCFASNENCAWSYHGFDFSTI